MILVPETCVGDNWATCHVGNKQLLKWLHQWLVFIYLFLKVQQMWRPGHCDRQIQLFDSHQMSSFLQVDNWKMCPMITFHHSGSGSYQLLCKCDLRFKSAIKYITIKVCQNQEGSSNMCINLRSVCIKQIHGRNFNLPTCSVSAIRKPTSNPLSQ